MGEIQLLDCTLRDGGYLNDWEFGHNHLISIYERVVSAGTDIVEIGFLDDRRPFDIHRSIMPDTTSVQKIYGCAAVRPPMVVGMIDYGTCKIENIQPCGECFLDGIRVIFKKHIMHEAIEYCAQVKALGYKVFVQLVSITSYADDDLMELIGLVNEIRPYAVSMVDTYGLLHPDDLLHYYYLLDMHVAPEIKIGFHAHNNFQLAYANALAFLKKETKRDILVDGTLYGMGKSAGNAPIELLAMHLNQKDGKNYQIQQFLEAIDESIMEFYMKCQWGYKPFFYLSASKRCHPSYVGYFQKKANLSVSNLYALLDEIKPEEKKLLYDQKVAENLYQTFLQEGGDDSVSVKKLDDALRDKQILLIGPGKNIQLQSGLVLDYIKKTRPTVISINYIPGAFEVDYVFVTKQQRYQMMTDALHEYKNKRVKIIATSNVTCVNRNFDYVLNREPLLEKNEDIVDNSLLMLLQVLKRVHVKEVVCAGFDGYSDKEDNYFNPKMEYRFVKEAARHLNAHMKEIIFNGHKDMKIEFLTYSHYTDSEDCYDAAF